MSHQDDVFVATFKGVLIFLIVLMFVIIFLANMIVGDSGGSAPVPGQKQSAAQESIAPVGKVKTAATASPATPAPASDAAPAAAQAVDGKQTYMTACMACHGTGAAGAPKVGDAAAWKDRIAQGMAMLAEHAIKGYQGKSGFMPAKGGRADLSDDAVKAAVEYMAAESK